MGRHSRGLSCLLLVGVGVECLDVPLEVVRGDDVHHGLGEHFSVVFWKSFFHELLDRSRGNPIDAGDDGVGAGRDGVGVGRERLERAAQLPMAIERRSKARMLNSHARDNRKRSRATNQRG